MKKLFSIIAISLLTLVGASTATAFITNKNQAQETQASGLATCNGLYERVEDTSKLISGTKVLLVTSSGYVFNGVGGNPAYAHGDPGGATLFGSYSDGDYYDDWHNVYVRDDNNKFLWLENKNALELTIEQGATGYPSNYVSFKADFTICGYSHSNHYLGENDEEGHGKADYEGVAWFLDGFGVRPTKDGKSTWELNYDSENRRMLIRKVSKDDDTSYICYSYNGARHHFLFGGTDGARVNLYTKVDDSLISKPAGISAPYQDPTKTNYRLGDKVDFNGLILKFRIAGDNDSYNDYLLAYDSNTNLLFSEPTTVDANYSQVSVRIFGLILYNIQITVISTASNNNYVLKNSLSADIRGTYLLVTSNDRIVHCSKETESTGNYIEKDHTVFDDNSITASDVDIYHEGSDVDQASIKIVRTEINGEYYYHAKNVNDEYLCLGSQVDSKNEYYIAYTSTPSISNAITVTSTSFKIGNYYIDNSEKTRLVSFVIDSPQPIKFYKLNESTSFVNNEVEEFIDFFESKTEVCSSTDDHPDFDKISDELWNDIKVAFERLGVDSQGIFASTTYIHGTASLQTKENVADRYDYILAKYNKEDFMLRKEANTYINNFSNSLSPIIIKNDYSLMIVIVISVISTAALLAFVILKKRKYR